MTSALLAVDHNNEQAAETTAIIPAITDDAAAPSAELPAAGTDAIGVGITPGLFGLHRLDRRIAPLVDGMWFGRCGAHVEPAPDPSAGPWCTTCWPPAAFPRGEQLPCRAPARQAAAPLSPPVYPAVLRRAGLGLRRPDAEDPR